MTRNTTRHAGRLRWALLAVTACLVGSQAWAASGPLDTETASNEVLVVLDPKQNTGEILKRLAQAGFPTTEVISGLPPRYRTYRKLSAPYNANTRAALLGVDGVLAVRPILRSPNVDYPILTNGQVIVKFQPGTTVAQVNALAVQNNCVLVRQMAGLMQTYVFASNDGSADPAAVAQAFANSGQTVYSQPSVLFKLQKHQTPLTINDPLYVFQWHLRNTGQLPGGVAGADISVEDAWGTTLGEGAIVANIDDCVQKDHEDLKDNYITGFDFLGFTPCQSFFLDPDCTFPIDFLAFDFTGISISGSDGDPSPFFGPDPFAGFSFAGDPVGEAHGTSTAGIICAQANDLGGRGVAPAAGLIGIKIGLGSYYTSDQDIADAFIFAELNGAMAINNSWGGPSVRQLPAVPNTFVFPNLVSDAIHQVAENGRSGRGVLVIFSAGNGDSIYGVPIPISFGNVYAALDNVMAVGATMRDDRVSCYSNFGPELSVMAPGGGVSAISIFGDLGATVGCYDSDITTTDVMETPCFLPSDYLPLDQFGFPIGDGVFDEGFPCRGVNPPLRFLNVVVDPRGGFGFPGCQVDLFGMYLSNPALCVPLVSNTFVDDFPQVNYTHHFNGTSAAAPMVTGVAALVFSVNSNLTAEQVRNIIEHTADKPGYINETFDGVTGHNERYGHGRVNAGRAVAAAAAGQNWPSPVRDVQEVHSQTLVRLLWTNPENDAAGVLIVRGTGSSLNWAPVDGVSYDVGQQVAPNVVVVSNDLIENLDQTGLPSGDFHYALFVRNAQNFYSWGRRTGFTSVGAVDRPVAAISASPRTGPVPLTVHFAGGGIDRTGIVAYSWNFGDGTTASGAAADHTYTQGGTITATLTVTNAVGQTGSTSVVIQPQAQANALPTVAITATPTTGNAPLVVVFRGTASDSDGFITGYSWDFGDGTTGSGQTVEHIYLVPGTYGAVLNVTDSSGGVGSASQIIMVTGTAPTAGTTDPPGILNTSQGLCGLGTAGAMSLSLLGLALMSVRRRY